MSTMSASRKVTKLLEAEQFDQAKALLKVMIGNGFKAEQTYNDLIYTCMKLGQYDQAKEYIQQALAIYPTSAFLYFNLGVIYTEEKDNTLARQALTKATELDPYHSVYWQALANVVCEQGDINLGMEYYQASIKLDQTNYRSMFGLSECYLLKEQFHKGWTYYEAREVVAERNSNPRYGSIFRWAGHPLQGKKLLLHAEQGLGDTIQFARYVIEFANRGAEVTFEVPDQLIPLLSCLPVKVIGRQDPIGQQDYQIPLMSVGYWLPDLFKVEVPYLKADTKASKYWQEVLKQCEGVKVGVCHQGTKGKGILGLRSIPESEFSAIIGISGYSFINLCKDSPLQSAICFKDLDRDAVFLDTAAIISNLDLVITIDTAVAHLAGALGVPTWLLLPKVADWRWFEERVDSPWYPLMSIIRQTVNGDWSCVIDQVIKELN